MTLHGLTPHHHDVGVDMSNCRSGDIAEFSEWLQEFFHHDLGEGHLEHFVFPDDDKASIDVTALPVLFIVQLAALQVSGEVELGSAVFIHRNESPPDKIIPSDSPLRGPPSRA